MDFENRFTAELQSTDDGKLVGYAAVFNSRSHDLGGFREILKPGSFDRTLKEFPDVLALVEHDTNRVLARTTNGSLKITPDAKGLRVEITPADTSYARDLLALVKRGDVAGMSFRFRPFPGGASTRSGLRTLTAVQLREVSVVVRPAYPETSVAVRDLEAARREATRLRKMRLRLVAA
jgi:HK97 family phage prohead protease